MILASCSYPLSGDELLNIHIQRRMEVPHVPLRFIKVETFDQSDVDKFVTVIRNPLESISLNIAQQVILNSQLIENINTLVLEEIKKYNNFYNSIHMQSGIIYRQEDIKEKINFVIINLFDKLNLDENNYINKTKQKSLRLDVVENGKLLNKIITNDNEIMESTIYQDILIKLNNHDLNQSYILYNKILEKAEQIEYYNLDKIIKYPNISKLFKNAEVPYSFENLKDYKTEDNFTKKYGTGIDTIKYFENFVTDDDNKKFMDLVLKWKQLENREHCYPVHISEGFSMPEQPDYYDYAKYMGQKMKNFAEEKWNTGLTLNHQALLMVHPKGTYLKPHTDILDIHYENNDPDHDNGPTQKEQLEKYPNLWDGYLAILCYMNEDFDGGYLYFPDYDYYLKPKKNSIIMFPGGLHCVHGVTEITNGTRYTISQWAKFDIY